MSRIKTLIYTLAVFVAQLIGTPQASAETQFSDPTRQFATCAGRMYALLEHHWLIAPDKVAETQALHMHFSDLVDATMSPERSREILTTRVEARMSFRKMLEASKFSKQTEQNLWLEHRVTQLITQCRSMLLS